LGLGHFLGAFAVKHAMGIFMFGICFCFFPGEIKGGHASFQNRDFSFAGKNSAQVGSRLAYPRPGGEGTEPNHLHGELSP